MRKIADLSRLSQILIAPLVSEKTTNSGERENSVTFWVKPDASKPEILGAIQEFFPALVGKVESIRTLVLRGKCTKRGSVLGQKVKRKKAYIKLSPGTELKFEGLE